MPKKRKWQNPNVILPKKKPRKSRRKECLIRKDTTATLPIVDPNDSTVPPSPPDSSLVNQEEEQETRKSPKKTKKNSGSRSNTKPLNSSNNIRPSKIAPVAPTPLRTRASRKLDEIAIPEVRILTNYDHENEHLEKMRGVTNHNIIITHEAEDLDEMINEAKDSQAPATTTQPTEQTGQFREIKAIPEDIREVLEEETSSENTDDESVMLQHYKLELMERQRNGLRPVFMTETGTYRVPGEEEFLKSEFRRSYYKNRVPERLPEGEWEDVDPYPSYRDSVNLPPDDNANDYLDFDNDDIGDNENASFSNYYKRKRSVQSTEIDEDFNISADLEEDEDFYLPPNPKKNPQHRTKKQNEEESEDDLHPLNRKDKKILKKPLTKSNESVPEQYPSNYPQYIRYNWKLLPEKTLPTDPDGRKRNILCLQRTVSTKN